jgi:hypothetical protein
VNGFLLLFGGVPSWTTAPRRRIQALLDPADDAVRRLQRRPGLNNEGSQGDGAKGPMA